VAGVWI
jgi:hypothetical protein